MGFDLVVDKPQGRPPDRAGPGGAGREASATNFYWSPEVKLGYRAKLMGDQGVTTASFAGGTTFTLDPEDVAAGGLVARAGFKGGTEFVLFSVDGGGVFGDAYKEYDVHATLRFKF
jgi:hypothetical protein